MELLDQAQTAGAAIFGATSVVLLALTVYLAVMWRRQGTGGLLVLTCLLTTIWASTSALGLQDNASLFGWSLFAETLRTIGWAAFLLALMSRLIGTEDQKAVPTGLWGLLGSAALASLALLISDATLALRSGQALGAYLDREQWYFAARLLPIVAGLAMVENLYRNTTDLDRWSIRPLAIALGGVFLYDLVLYAHAFLYGVVEPSLFLARGAVSVILVPLIGVAASRNPAWHLRVFVSRRAVFHTVSIFGSGFYLIGVAAVGYYLRVSGGDWGALLQTIFMSGAAILLVAALLSGQFRSRVRVFFNKHFFRYNYDYREEWLRFIRTVSSVQNYGRLQIRVIEAVCDIADSPGGHLFLRSEADGAFQQAARWNFKDWIDARVAFDDPMIDFLQRTEWIVDVDEWSEGHSGYEGLPVPAWLTQDDRAWVVLPLLHLDRLLGFMVLERARTPRSLDWEDRDLLKTVARQVASYLSEQAAEKALADAREFESFNQRFAFVMHDLKNLVSQLSLVVKNAEKHAHNPEFQADMLETVRDSATKMRLLLDRLNDQAKVDVLSAEDINLVQFITDMAETFRKLGKEVTVRGSDDPLWVTGDRERLSTAFGHLIQNGFDAMEDDGRVEMEILARPSNAEIQIVDRGSGMSEDFIRQDLFKPFRSTKSAGYGIGVFESRSIIRDHQGDVTVRSKLGEGTVFSVTLPLSNRTMVQSAVPKSASAS